MITMKVGSGAKAPVRFEFSDGISETTVTIHPGDESGAIAAKLQRVLELEGVPLPTAPPAQRISIPEPEFGPLFDAAGVEALVTAQPMGWERLAAEGDDDLPIHD